MDSLLPSPKSAASSLKIPYLNAFEDRWFPGGFRTLRGLNRTGHGQVSIEPTDISILSVEDRASLIQSWLFFGLISEFFGSNVPASSFLRSDPVYGVIVVLNPQPMTELFTQWETDFLHLSEEEKRTKIQSVSETMDFAATQVETFDYPIESDGHRHENPVLPLITLSVRLLISYFRLASQAYLKPSNKSSARSAFRDFPMVHLPSAADHAYRAETPHRSVTIPIPPGGRLSLSTQLLLRVFITSKWCPVRARQICQSFDYSTAYYLSRLRRSDPDDIHHASCEGADECVAYNLSRDQQRTYNPKHLEAGCQCTLMTTRKDVLIRTIERGKIPILSMDPEAPQLDIRMHEHSGILPYVAISHVWSDGLGNSMSNSLPLCQLRHLAQVLFEMKQQKWARANKVVAWSLGRHRMRREQKRRVFFWMDTMCIPAQSLEGRPPLKELKRRAIRYITPIFEAAENVLVLDSELQRLPMSLNVASIDEEDLAARVISSKWLQRAWTLEEGALARECLFKLHGVETMTLGELPGKRIKGSNKPQRIWSRIPPRNLPLKSLLSGILNEERKQAVRPGKGKRALNKFIKSRTSQFVEAWNNLLERSATKSTDPLLIFANMLDFNAVSIAALNEKKRLPTIIRSCEELPASLLFNTRNIFDTSCHPQDAWIPTDIFGDKLVNNATLIRKASIFEDQVGFQINRATSLPDLFIVITTSVRVPYYEFVFCLEGINGNESYVVELQMPSSRITVPDSYAVLAQEMYDFSESTCIIIDKLTGSDSLNGYSGRGARLSVRKVEKSEVLLRFDCSITAWSYDQWKQSKNSTILPKRTFTATQLPPNQHIVLEADLQKDPRRRRPILPAPSIYIFTKLHISAGVLSEIVLIVIVQLTVPSCTIGSNAFVLCSVIRVVVLICAIPILSVIFLLIWRSYTTAVYNLWLRTFDDDWVQIGLMTRMRRAFQKWIHGVLRARGRGEDSEQAADSILLQNQAREPVGRNHYM